MLLDALLHVRLANGDERLQLEKVLLPDYLHGHQVFDLLEAAVLPAVVDDVRRQLGADPGQRIELLGGGGVDVDDDGGRGFRRRPDLARRDDGRREQDGLDQGSSDLHSTHGSSL